MGPERDCTTKVLVGSHKCLGTAIYYINFFNQFLYYLI